VGCILPPPFDLAQGRLSRLDSGLILSSPICEDSVLKHTLKPQMILLE
jgi:hypothetical protein